MKAAEFAKRLNGIELAEIGREVKREAERANMVIVYGEGRETVHFAGVIEGEADVPEGGAIHFDLDGLLPDAEDIERAPEEVQRAYYDRKRLSYLVDAYWQMDGFIWSFNTIIPHHRFMVLNEGARYCRGIVFDVKSLGGAA